MKNNLLLNKIIIIQHEYKELLAKLLPILQTSSCHEVFDEINIFWFKYNKIIQLYYYNFFVGNDSYVFTASTYLNYDEQEFLPFLLVGNKHVFDDPLSKFSQIINKNVTNFNQDILYNQIVLTIQNNLKLLENINNNIFILPLRLLTQSNTNNFLYDLGEKFFISLFNEIDNIDDYFNKCSNIHEIKRYIRNDVINLISFTVDDNKLLSFEERFHIALNDLKHILNPTKSDAYNFFMIIFGYIQQAIDIMASCIEYKCIPFIRNLVTVNYILLVTEGVEEIEHIKLLRYKMIIAYLIYAHFDRDILSSINFKEFIKINKEYNFNGKLFNILIEQNINKTNFSIPNIESIISIELQKFYNELLSKC